VGAGAATRFLYDGTDMIAEYNGSNALQRRYVHGPGSDEPIMWYEGSVLTNKRYLMADERGSVVNVTDSAGAVTAINSYDEYGIPKSTTGTLSLRPVGGICTPARPGCQSLACIITRRGCIRQR
jgi:hypothetical protein